VAVGVPSSSTTVFTGVPVSVTVIPAVSLSVMVIVTWVGSVSCGTTSSGRVPNSSTSVSMFTGSSMSSAVAVKVSVPLFCPMAMLTVPAGEPERLKSSVDAVGLPLVRIWTGISSALGAFAPRFTVTVSVPPSVTAPLLFTASDASTPSTSNTGDMARKWRLSVLAPTHPPLHSGLAA